MAATLVGGAFLSATLQVLFDRLASRPVWDFIRGQKFSPALLKKLNIKLLAVHAVLNDAEEKQITDPLVKAWVDELKDAVHVADDLLDEIATEALRSKLEAESDPSSDQVWSTSSTSVSSFDQGMKSRIDEVLDRLHYSLQQKDVLGLIPVRGRTPSQRLPTTSLVGESIVYGRDDDKKKVIEFLLSDTDASSGHEICVFTIVGMGGVGKTTLAQLVYNDSKVQDFFNLKPWVCVSEELNVLTVTKTILEAIDPSHCDSLDLNLLQVRLKNSLIKKKCLLVLDDVWDEDYKNWEFLRTPFRFGAKGSKIIVTTRNTNVATIIGSGPIHHLKQLLEEDCWSLLAKHAFDTNNSNKLQELEVIGRKIVKKCKGLPLAAKTLGGLLHSKADVAEWDGILRSELWGSLNDKNIILPALRLSYHYLPSYLKCCFAYCSIFPKDYEFEKQQVVLLWMAEGFLQDPQKNKQMEEVGDVYFNDLISRSFFQKSTSDKSRFVMHDLVNDLAKYVCGEFCFRLEDKNICEISEKTRHFSYFRNNFDSTRKFKALNIAKDLRTFLPLNQLHHYGLCYLAHEVPQDTLLALRFLRVLSLSHYCNIRELPNSLGGLNHLRYLDLSYTAIRKLPDSTSNLCNLQTLLLRQCDELTELPADMGKLINLRHLDISLTNLKEMPMHMSKLKNLQTLSTFFVGKHEGSKIKELRELNDLHGGLQIFNLENVVNTRDAQESNLKDKVHIEELQLQWSIEADVSQTARDVLDKLQPQTKLKKLTIKGYGSTKLPDWLGDQSFSNMVFLCLRNCKHCFTLPPVGRLPSLRELIINRFDLVLRVGPEFYGKDTAAVVKPFEFLEILSFEDMPELTEWCSSADEGADFACLRELRIVNCPKLKGVLPDHLPLLTTLELVNCSKLVPFSGNDDANLQSSLNVAEMCIPANPEHFPLSSLPELFEISPMSDLQYSLNVPEILEISPMSDLQSSLNVAEMCIPVSSENFDWHSLPELFEISPMSDLQYSLNVPEILEISPMSDLQSSLNVAEMSIPVSSQHLSWSFLKKLEISGMPNLKELPQGLMLSVPGIKEFRISGCLSLESLPMTDLYTTAKYLYILECPKLDLLLPEPDDEIQMAHYYSDASLELLQISKSRETLKSFPLGLFPKLDSLELIDCENLESLWIAEGDNLMSLSSLFINFCPKFESFPKGGLPTPNLRNFTVGNCARLKSLPEVPSLQYLRVDNCPELESFPEGGLSTNLVSLVVSYCANLTYKGDLQRLPNLKSFEIHGREGVVDSFPEEWLLPSSLTNLVIWSFPNMKHLNQRGLQDLTSLQQLEIGGCSKLQCLPEEGLPNSLSSLLIESCPLLEKWCGRDKGQGWPKIAQIPNILINKELRSHELLPSLDEGQLGQLKRLVNTIVHSV